MNNKRKAATLLLSYMLMLGLHSNKETHSYDNLNYSINTSFNGKTDKCFGSFSKGNVYIVLPSDEIEEIITNSNDIIAIDKRFGDDPNFSIYNSIKVNNPDAMLEILSLLKEYDKQYPSTWDRSIVSMKDEWIIHNLCYYLNILPHNTSSVDLNNNDRIIYGDFCKRK